MPTPDEWLASIIEQAINLREVSTGAPTDDVSKTLREIDAQLSALLSRAEDNRAEE